MVEIGLAVHDKKSDQYISSQAVGLFSSFDRIASMKDYLSVFKENVSHLEFMEVKRNEDVLRLIFSLLAGLTFNF